MNDARGLRPKAKRSAPVSKAARNITSAAATGQSQSWRFLPPPVGVRSGAWLQEVPCLLTKQGNRLDWTTVSDSPDEMLSWGRLFGGCALSSAGCNGGGSDVALRARREHKPTL